MLLSICTNGVRAQYDGSVLINPPGYELVFFISSALLGVADGFGFTLQSVYYSGMDAVEDVGGGRAMGVYSTFESMSQTAAPFVFGSALLLGTGPGILAVGGGMGVFTALFLLTRGRKKYRRRAA